MYLILAAALLAQPPNWMEEKLKELSQKGDAQPADWQVEENGVYVINGDSYKASLVPPSDINGQPNWLFTWVPSSEEPPYAGARVLNQFNRTAPVLRLGEEFGIPPSMVVGWGLVNNLNEGLCGSDGWEDQIGRENAMLLSRANSRLTRFEYGLYGGDGIPDANGGTWGKLMSWGWEDPSEFDGWLVFDVETWNMTLMSRRPDKSDTGRGYVWDREADSLTLTRWYKDWRNKRFDERVQVHPYGVDTDGDGVKDALRFTRQDVINEHIRIVRKLQAIFPKAKWTAYNFPNMGYWTSDEDEAYNQANWREACQQLHDAGVLDALGPSVYDHYSHLFRFPDTDDDQWKRLQRIQRDRDRQRFGRGVKHALEAGDSIGIPVLLYTWDVFHNDGRCSKSGWVIPWEEWEDHIRGLLGVSSDAGTRPQGFILWGARRWYWERDECYRASMETYIKDFDEYDLNRAAQLMSRAARIASDTWE